MSEFLKFMRRELAALEVAGTTVQAFEISLRHHFGGDEIYVPRRDPAITEDRRRLIRAGVAPRTARFKIRP